MFRRAAFIKEIIFSLFLNTSQFKLGGQLYLVFPFSKGSLLYPWRSSVKWQVGKMASWQNGKLVKW
jgi:hypothetical protein